MTSDPTPQPMPLHRPLVRRPLAALLVLAAAACGEATVATPPAAPAAKVDVRADRDGATLLLRTPSAPRGERGGTSLQLDAAVFNPQGKELEHKRHVYWTSGDTLVATVDSTGLVTAQDTGTVAVVVDHKKGVDTVV